MMELKDLQELRDAIGMYVQCINNSMCYHYPQHLITEKLKRLSDARDAVDFNQFVCFLQNESVHEVDMIGIVGSLLNVCREAINVIEQNKSHIKNNIDTDVIRTLHYFRELEKLATLKLSKLKERIWIDPTHEDIDSFDDIEDYFSGYYEGIELGEFIKGYIINGLSPKETIRRLNFLIGRYTNDEQTKCVLEAELQKHKEKQSESTKATNDEPLQKPSASPAPIAPNDDKPENPDFSHMRSFQPEKELSLHNLYEFLITEGVIRDMDEALFTDCIYHGNIKCIYIKKNKKVKIKVVVSFLKHYFSEDWYDSICKSISMSKSEITKVNTKTYEPFAKKLIGLV